MEEEVIGEMGSSSLHEGEEEAEEEEEEEEEDAETGNEFVDPSILLYEFGLLEFEFIILRRRYSLHIQKPQEPVI